MPLRSLFVFVLAALPLLGRPAHPAQAPAEVPAVGGGAQEELRRLFRAVERDLRRIDQLLEEARAARRADPAPQRAELLQKTRESGERVLEGIDRILELAAQNSPSSSGSGSSSSSSGQPQSGGAGSPSSSDSSGQPSPLDRGQQETSGREATPAGPERRASGGEAPEGEQGQDQRGQGQQGPGQSPRPLDGNRTSAGEGRNERSGDPAQRPGGPGSAADPARDRWGDLPEHARETFRMQGGSDLPPRYRDWIDAYYKRLNRKP